MSNCDIRIQCNDYDFYQWRPTHLDTNLSLSLPDRPFVSVPVIRFYSSLPSGHNVLCHLHGVFPYIYMKYDGQVGTSKQTIEEHCRKLHELLENAMKGANLARHAFAEDRPVLRYIANVAVVKAVPFYGFHVGWSAFYMISLIDPKYCSQLSHMLRDGEIFGYEVETYESHIPYLLQMAADYNIFGCSWLKLSNCYFRQPVLQRKNRLDTLYGDTVLDETILALMQQSGNILDEFSFQRIGNGLLEIDIIPQFIKNRNEIKYQAIHHDFIEKQKYTDTSFVDTRMASTDQLWQEIGRLRDNYGLGTYSTPADIFRVESQPTWNADILSKFYDQKVKESTSHHPQANFRDFVNNSPWYELLKTPDLAIMDLWPNIGQGRKHATYASESHPTEGLDPPADVNLKRSRSEGNFNLTAAREEAEEDDDEGEDEPLLISSFDDFSFTKLLAKKRRLNSVSDSNDEILQQPAQGQDLSVVRGSQNHTYKYRRFPISYEHIIKKLEDEGKAAIDYPDIHFSNPVDYRKAYNHVDKRFSISTNHISERQPVEFSNEPVVYRPPSLINGKGRKRLLYILRPPSYKEVLATTAPVTLAHSQISSNVDTAMSSLNPMDQLESHKGDSNGCKLVNMSVELHIDTRPQKLPDPEKDSVKGIFWFIDGNSLLSTLGYQEGIMLFIEESELQYKDVIKKAAGNVRITFYNSEYELLEAFILLVLEVDPDILSGYEVNKMSFGYIVERARSYYELYVDDRISRVSKMQQDAISGKWNKDHAAALKITGRHMLNVWRRLRSESPLLYYTFEHVVFKFFKERTPHYSFDALNDFWHSNPSFTGFQLVFIYWLKRVRYNIALINCRQIISRTVEEARLIGIDFYSVISRGSQYKVESILLRRCKAERFFLVSPSATRLRNQRPLEHVPLIIEPEAAFYKSPMVVLDFQSLYPSIIRAYNYCYSTMLGRVRELSASKNALGITTSKLPPGLLDLVRDEVTISPNGVVFVKPTVRKSILSKLLEDILSSRFLVKETMQELKGSSNLKQILGSRQLALKLLANVIYGYTAASYSGRMPCSDIADSIVQTAHETLRSAIQMIESEYSWGANVVYGDTDSLFVYLPGKSLQQAFEIGKNIAAAVTAANPAPVELKFEKVYHPCILVTKKRYVGYAYTDVKQASPVFDAKGIETVRRDSTPAQQKIVQKALEILFTTKDLSQLKHYIVEQFRKISSGSLNIQDFCFSREVRLGSYASESSAPPAAALAKSKMQKDRMAEPQYRERLLYLVTKGKPGDRLVDRCVTPEQYLKDPKLELDSDYYITKTLIPPLERFLNLVGLNIRQWYLEISRMSGLNRLGRSYDSLPTSVKSRSCLSCQSANAKRNNIMLCENCENEKGTTAIKLLNKKLTVEARIQSILNTCRSCSSSLANDTRGSLDKAVSSCDSQECPVYYSRKNYDSLLSTSSWMHINSSLEHLNKW